MIPSDLNTVEMVEPDCAACEDNGWVVDGGSARRCECQSPARNEEKLRQMLAMAGMEYDDIESAFAPWDSAFMPDRILVQVEAWAVKVAQWDGSNASRLKTSLVSLLGLPGRSKTTVAAKAAAAFLRSGGEGLFWACVPEWAEAVMLERRSRDMPEVLQERAAGCRLLILDELAAESTPAQMALTENVLSRRHRRRLPTLITTNAKSIQDLGDGRIASRLASGFWRTLGAKKDYRTFRGRIELPTTTGGEEKACATQ